MLPNRKAEYALRALVDLAIHGAGGGHLATPAIARRTGAPAKFLEAILGELRRAGLVESRRGAAGGHRLARPARSITAGEGWRAVSGPPTTAARKRSPGSGAGRAVQELLSRIEAAAVRAAEETTLDELARRSLEADGIPDFSI